MFSKYLVMKKILIVDDDLDTLALVQTLLTMQGYEVLTHYTGLDVVDMVKRHNPDLVILDIHLPGKLGTEICKELKTINNLPAILLFSADAKEGDAFAICKADGFIRKPFDVHDFLKVIKVHTS